MAKKQQALERSDKVLKAIMTLIVAWVFATWSRIFFAKVYCVLKFYIENKTFGQSPYCELLPGFYSGTALTAVITFGWFIILIKVLAIIAKRR